MEHEYEGKIAFITGGTSGIGYASAAAFARAGARVVIAARSQDAGRASVAELDSVAPGPGRAVFVPTDVCEEASIERAVARALETFGRVDYAVNAAGISGDMASLERTDQAVWDDVMATNARGVWLAMRHEIPAMLQAGGGAVVNLSSVYGLVGRPSHHAYVASKHAVVGMTRSVALELASRGVRVNAICAGATRTASMVEAERVVPEVVDALVAEHPMRRMASVEEMASAVLWLCSDASAFVTGGAHAFDGGLLAA